MQPPINALFTVLRVLAGIVFAYSGWNKLSRPVQEFQYAIEAYQIFSSSLIRIVAHVIPWIELCLGVSLILGFLRKFVASVLSLLVLSFIALLVSTKIRGIEISNCGCFGEGIHLSVWQALCVDTTLFVILMMLAYRKTILYELDQLLEV